MMKKPSRLLQWGYLLVFLGCLFLDQTTKHHAEKNFLVYSHETELRNYRGSHHRVFTWGTSPLLLQERALFTSSPEVTPPETSANWLDFSLTYVRNPGAAWGLFGNINETIRTWLFHGITLVAIGFIVQLWRGSHVGQRLVRGGLTFIFAGAIGNFIDRIALGYVIDWLHFHWKIFGWEYSFPVFNVADVSINIGVGLMLLDMLLGLHILRSTDHHTKGAELGSTSSEKFHT